MTVQFDPYHKWLGIPQEEQPPGHYRLLGIARFEVDPDVIDAAFYRQTAHVRTYQLGPNSDLSQKLLNEIAGARACLIDPAKKAAYDAKLRATLATATERTAPGVSPDATKSDMTSASNAGVPLPASRSFPFPGSSASIGARSGRKPARAQVGRRRTSSSPLIEAAKVILGGIAGLLLAYCLLLFVFQINILGGLSSRKPTQLTEQPAEQQPEPPEAQPPTDQARVLPSDPDFDPRPVIEHPAAAIEVDADEQVESAQMPPPKQVAPPLAIAPFDERTAKQHQANWAEYLGLPGEFRSSIGMDFVLIPPGEFLMGSTDSYGTSRSGEERQHQVRLTKPFYLGAYEVTQGEYEQVMGDNPSQFKGDRHLPVESVSWEEAMEFCRRLSALSEGQSAGWLYRLPTEAEWEYACRAGTTAIYSFSDSATSLGDYAWYSGNSIRKTHPVGQKKPDVWGLYDMHGNVSEWCTDWWDADNYASSSVNDSVGLDAGSARVYRGGSWSSTARGCRSAHRGGALPAYRGDDLGFRLAYSAVE